MEFYGVFPDDPVGRYWVLGQEKRGSVLLRDEYLDLRCHVCGKVNEEAAVERFVSANVRITSRRDAGQDFILSADNIILVSQRFIKVAEAHKISGMKLYPLPGDDRFQIFVPARTVGRFEESGLRIETPPATGWSGGWDIKPLACAEKSEVTALLSSIDNVGRDSERATELIKQFIGSKGGLRQTTVSSDGRCAACRRHFATYGFVRASALTPPKRLLAFFTPSFNHESRRGNRFKVYCSEKVIDVLFRTNLAGFRVYATDSNTQMSPRNWERTAAKGRGRRSW